MYLVLLVPSDTDAGDDPSGDDGGGNLVDPQLGVGEDDEGQAPDGIESGGGCRLSQNIVKIQLNMIFEIKTVSQLAFSMSSNKSSKLKLSSGFAILLSRRLNSLELN